MGLTRNSIIISGVIMAFIVGSITTGTMTSAQKDGQGGNLIIDALNNIADAINGITPTQTVTVQSLEGPEGPAGPQGEQGPEGPAGSSGPEEPISIANNFMTRNVLPCPISTGTKFFASGSTVLLSDGTVKVPSPTGGFTTPDPLFGSLPAGVWHDIEGTYDFVSVPEACDFPTQTTDNRENLRACAVADNGDVYCVDGRISNGVLSGTPWTFQGDAIP